MFDKLLNTAIRKSVNIELLLLRNERSHIRWFGHVSRMPQEWLPKQTLYAEAREKRGQLDDHGQNEFIKSMILVWNRLRLSRCKMQSVFAD